MPFLSFISAFAFVSTTFQKLVATYFICFLHIFLYATFCMYKYKMCVTIWCVHFQSFQDIFHFYLPVLFFLHLKFNFLDVFGCSAPKIFHLFPRRTKCEKTIGWPKKITCNSQSDGEDNRLVQGYFSSLVRNLLH